MSEYHVFISYSHADAEIAEVFESVLRGLLRGTFGRSKLKIFRDESSLAAGSDLSGTLQDAMKSSEWLVVLLTPSSSTSLWVDREIRYWCDDLGKSDRLLIVRGHSSVDLEWDEGAGRFRDQHGLPPSLVVWSTRHPLWLEMSDHTDDQIVAAARRVAASVLGVAPDEVAGEEKLLRRRRRRRLIQTACLIAVLGATAALFAVFALRARSDASLNERVAEEQREIAEAERSEGVAQLLSRRALLEANNRPDKALALAIASNALEPRSSGEEALLQLLPTIGASARVGRLPGSENAIALSPDSSTLAIGSSSRVTVTGLTEDLNELTVGFDAGAPVTHLAFANDGRLVVGTSDGKLAGYQSVNGTFELIASIELKTIDALAASSSSNLLSVGGIEGDGEQLATIEFDDDGLEVVARDVVNDFWITDLEFAPTGDTIIVGQFRQIETLGSDLDVLLADPIAVAAESSFVETGAVERLDDGSIAVGGNPSETAERSGIIEVFRPDGRRDEFGFAGSVDALAGCGNVLYYGTRSGEIGQITGEFDLELVRIGEEVIDLACGSDGELIVLGGDGLLLRFEQTARFSDGLSFEVQEVDFSDTLAVVSAETRLSVADGLIAAGDEQWLISPSTVAMLSHLAGLDDLTSNNCLQLGVREIEADPPMLDGTCPESRIEVDPATGGSVAMVTAEQTWSIPDSARLRTWSASLSGDGSRAFVGGGNVGGLYSLRPGRPAEELITFETFDFFTAASFLGSGDVMLTLEESPQGDFGVVRLHVIGGIPLSGIACRVSEGTLVDTVAEDLLTLEQLGELEC